MMTRAMSTEAAEWPSLSPGRNFLLADPSSAAVPGARAQTPSRKKINTIACPRENGIVRALKRLHPGRTGSYVVNEPHQHPARAAPDATRTSTHTHTNSGPKRRPSNTTEEETLPPRKRRTPVEDPYARPPEHHQTQARSASAPSRARTTGARTASSWSST